MTESLPAPPPAARTPPPAGVFATYDEIARRPGRGGAGPPRGTRALRDLAARLAGEPGAVLPRLVELAMEATGAASAGLSLHEPEPAPDGVFRWRHLRGALAAFEGGTAPRHDSPCGVALDRAAPVLARRPERAYGWMAAAGVAVPEALLVPLRPGGPEPPLGTLWVVADREGHFDAGHARAAAGLAAFAGAALPLLREHAALRRALEGQRRDRERLRRALEEQETLAREMSHRVENFFALADGMVRLGAKAPGGKAEMAAALSGRLGALAAAHALVRAVAVAPHEGAGPGAAPRFALDGPPVALGARAAGALALALHELATNAAKHGALAAAAGRVAVGWRLEGGRLVLRWAERGGPPVAGPPAREGFGARLLHAVVARQLGGAVERDWGPGGLTATLAVPADRLAA